MIIKEFQKNFKIYRIYCDGKRISKEKWSTLTGEKTCFFTYQREDGVFVHCYEIVRQ